MKPYRYLREHLIFILQGIKFRHQKKRSAKTDYSPNQCTDSKYPEILCHFQIGITQGMLLAP